MHPITLSSFAWDRALLGIVRTAFTLVDTTNCDTLCIAEGTRSFAIGGVTSTRTPIRAVSRSDLMASRLGVDHLALLVFFERMGHCVDLDTMISVVRWTHCIAPATLPVVTFQTQEAMEAELVTLKYPDIQLNSMLTSIGQALPGQAVAIGVRYETGATTTLCEDNTRSTLRVLVRTENGFAVRTLSTLSIERIVAIEQWLHYGSSINDWNLAVGERAATHLSAFGQGTSYTTEVFFFVDRALALADAPHRVMVMALPEHPDTASSHAKLAHTLRFPQVINALTTFSLAS